VGAGFIGRSWAVVFARAGCEVRLFDHVAGVAESALEELAQLLDELEHVDLLDGQRASEVHRRVSAVLDLGQAVEGCAHVQENTPEVLELKRGVLAQIDEATPPDAVIASSTSALLPSQLAAGLAGGARCLVAHPLNPPHLIPAVEIVPGPATAPEAVARTRDLMETVGQNPIVLTREVEGFVMNRLQGALLDEAMALVAEGLTSVADIDAAMRDGLGRRWSFMGPFETIDLNAPGGAADFIDRYGSAYAEIGRGRPNRHAWTGNLAETITSACRTERPLEALPARRAWRDARLAALAAHLRKQQQAEE
jgi:3-hydroxyacyl-CoA dehydrogenase